MFVSLQIVFLQAAKVKEAEDAAKKIEELAEEKRKEKERLELEVEYLVFPSCPVLVSCTRFYSFIGLETLLEICLKCLLLY